MTRAASTVTSEDALGNGLPEYGLDEVSRITYPPTTEKMTEDEFVRRTVKGRWSWLLWMLMALIAFLVFVASAVAVVDIATAQPPPKKERLVDR